MPSRPRRAGMHLRCRLIAARPTSFLDRFVSSL